MNDLDHLFITVNEFFMINPILPNASTTMRVGDKGMTGHNQADAASGHWLALSRAPLENSSLRLQLVNKATGDETLAIVKGLNIRKYDMMYSASLMLVFLVQIITVFGTRTTRSLDHKHR